MSLLDDVSIVVTPNGYKAGELYAVIPVPTLGSELVTNGDFSADASWTKGTGWTISGGTASCDGSQSGNTDLSQNITTDTGKQYKITYTVSNYSAGSIFIRLNSGNVTSTKSSNGTFTEILSGAGGTQVILRANLDFIGSVDNVSVKEWTASDMDVTRATAATRVDENGLVNYAQVVGSEVVINGDFDTDSNWAKGANTTISGGKLNSNSAGVYVIASQVPSPYIFQNKVYKYSVTYTITSGSVRLGDSNQVWAGSTQSTSGTYTNIVTSSSVANGQIYFTSPSSDFVGSIDNVSVKETDLNNVPRIDYTGGGCPHILAEPQRTNSLFQSNQFDTTWVLTNSSVVGNQSGIYNTTDAWKLVGNGSNNDRLNSNSLSSGAYTFSIYAKAGNSKFTAVVLGSAVVYYNLETGSVGSAANVTNSSIESVGNDWYRLTLSVASFTGSAQIYIANGVGNVNTSNGDFIYLQHAQAEVGSYATSIIPTSGSAVTRNKDVFTRDGIASLINSTEGVLFGEIAALSNTSTDRVMLSLSDGTTSNRVYIRYGNASNQIEARSTVGGANSGLTSFVVTDETDFIKVAYKWKLNDYALWINGVEVATVSSGVVNSANTLNKLSFDSGSGTRIAEGKIKQLMCFDEALSDEELSDLTGQANLSFNNLAEFYGYTIL
jgi:hypothetical protein